VVLIKLISPSVVKADPINVLNDYIAELNLTYRPYATIFTDADGRIDRNDADIIYKHIKILADGLSLRPEIDMAGEAFFLRYYLYDRNSVGGGVGYIDLVSSTKTILVLYKDPV